MKWFHFVDILLLLVWTPIVNSDISYTYEKLNHFGMGLRSGNARRNGAKVDVGFNMYAHPEPLPTKKPQLKTVSEQLYQGTRLRKDKRVFYQRYNDTEQDIGYVMYWNGLFDCILTFLAVENEGGMPILLRGGMGYRYFQVAVKVKPHTAIRTRVRAYCPKEKDDNA